LWSRDGCRMKDPVRLGSVDLPPGRLIMGCLGLDHVAWVTADPVPDAGRVWAALSELHPRTGLVPIQVDGRPGQLWDPLNLSGTENPRDADGLDADTLLAEMWQDGRPGEPDLGWVELRGPFRSLISSSPAITRLRPRTPPRCACGAAAAPFTTSGTSSWTPPRSPRPFSPTSPRNCLGSPGRERNARQGSESEPSPESNTAARRRI
jgi:hypothetical protein